MSDFQPQSAALDASGFRDAAPQLSRLRFYSLGYVAANKLLDSKLIEAVPIEELPMIDGEIDAYGQPLAVQGKDAQGKPINAKALMANSIQAEWLPFCDSQRLTAPDVRRGESVMLYQFGDADKYYWTTLKNDNRLRKLETVIWGFSATTKESDGMTSQTSYFLEISTHKKLVTFHTSQANGEPFGYDVQINAAEGKIVIADTAGNELLIDSAAQHARIKNSAGSYAEVIANVANFYAADQINAKTSSYTVQADNISLLSSANTTVQAGGTVHAQSGSLIRLQAPKLETP